MSGRIPKPPSPGALVRYRSPSKSPGFVTGRNDKRAFRKNSKFVTTRTWEIQINSHRCGNQSALRILTAVSRLLPFRSENYLFQKSTFDPLLVFVILTSSFLGMRPEQSFLHSRPLVRSVRVSADEHCAFTRLTLGVVAHLVVLRAKSYLPRGQMSENQGALPGVTCQAPAAAAGRVWFVSASRTLTPARRQARLGLLLPGIGIYIYSRPDRC